MHGIGFQWPVSGSMKVTALPGGGCSVKIAFADSGVIRAIGKGRIFKARNVPTGRIAQHYEIIIRHDDDFESSYSITDQTPPRSSGRAPLRVALGNDIEAGAELYEIANGGVLHFQLSRAGRLVDPREYIRNDVPEQ